MFPEKCYVSQRFATSPGIIKKQVEWGDRTLEVACVYAPSEAAKRVTFFNNVLSKELTSKTYAGGDWNCVPDVTLDVDSDNPLRYHAQNQGADILETIMSNIGLTDNGPSDPLRPFFVCFVLVSYLRR